MKIRVSAQDVITGHTFTIATFPAHKAVEGNCYARDLSCDSRWIGYDILVTAA